MAALHWLIHTRSPHSSIKRLFLFFFPSSVLFFLCLSLTSAFLLLITEGRGIMKPQLTQAVLGPVVEDRTSLARSLQWAPSHLLCSTYASSTHRFCFAGRPRLFNRKWFVSSFYSGSTLERPHLNTRTAVKLLLLRP